MKLSLQSWRHLAEVLVSCSLKTVGVTAVNSTRTQVMLPLHVPLLCAVACIIQVVWRHIKCCVLNVWMIVLHSIKLLISW